MEDERFLEVDSEDELENELDAEESDDPNESKNEKFIRIAESRMTKLLSWIRKLDNLSNKGNYEYTDEQVEQMFNALDEELREVKSHFLKSGKEKKKFKFTV